MKSLSCELPRVNLSYNHLLVPIHGQLELGMQLILEVKHHDVCDYPTQHLSHLHLQLTFLATWCVGFLLQWLWKTNISSNTTCFVPTGQCHPGRPASAIRSQCDNPCTLRLPALDCVISYQGHVSRNRKQKLSVFTRDSPAEPTGAMIQAQAFGKGTTLGNLCLDFSLDATSTSYYHKCLHKKAAGDGPGAPVPTPHW